MTDSTTSHEFDWVMAHSQCSLPHEFGRLKQLVENNCCTRRKYLPADNTMDFSFHATSEDHFTVSRFPVNDMVGSSYSVTFSLRNDHILIEDDWSKPMRRLALTLTLDDDGRCRFHIDGEGEYLRWQIARRALCPIFFHGPAERAGEESS